jgi:DNA-binding XRE family transcriptional regulator
MAEGRKSKLFAALPFPVDDSLKRLGLNLRTARIRRGLTLVAAAEKIGVLRWVVADAERGKPTTGIAVYVALLWAYDLLDEFKNIADPKSDVAGLALLSAEERQRVRQQEPLSDDF